MQNLVFRRCYHRNVLAAHCCGCLCCACRCKRDPRTRYSEDAAADRLMSENGRWCCRVPESAHEERQLTQHFTRQPLFQAHSLDGQRLQQLARMGTFLSDHDDDDGSGTGHRNVGAGAIGAQYEDRVTSPCLMGAESVVVI